MGKVCLSKLHILWKMKPQHVLQVFFPPQGKAAVIHGVPWHRCTNTARAESFFVFCFLFVFLYLFLSNTWVMLSAHCLLSACTLSASPLLKVTLALNPMTSTSDAYEALSSDTTCKHVRENENETKTKNKTPQLSIREWNTNKLWIFPSSTKYQGCS